VNSTIECTSTDTTSALNAWLASNGGAVANDACSNVTWTNNYTALSNGCGQTGSATVTFTATDDCGNATSTSAVFTIQDTTAPTLDPNGPALVAVINVACDAIPTVPQLQFIDGCSAFTEIVITQTSVTSTVSDTGTYTIIRTWTVSDACGNPTTLTQTVNVTIPNYIQTYTHEPVCNIDTTLIVDFTDVINEQFPGVISANGTWSEVGTTISGALNTSNGEFTPLDVPEGVYVIQYNNNDPICPRIIQITIEVDSEVCIVANCVTLTVHNAFTPNNDGINEVFFIDNITNPCYAENKVEIYNRWGVKVFDTENYNNIDKVFTGVSEGRSTIKQSSELPTGTYFYILKYKNIEGDYSTKNGYLYLSR
jgi:gliding motility-associated-like protein